MLAVKITFAEGTKDALGYDMNAVTIKNVVNFEFPKVKTLKINMKNGLSYCYKTKAIKKIEVINV